MNLRALKTAALVLASVASASAIFAAPVNAAVTVPFSFDNMNGVSSQGQQSTQIAAYMTSVLSSYYAGSTVNVSGGIGQQGPLANAPPPTTGSYAGEGYVVGPKSGSTVTPYTLANTNNGVYDSTSTQRANDGFIKNCTGNDSCTNGSSSDIYMSFGTHKISSFSFDFEIFPDGSCTALNTAVGQNNCGKAVAGNLNPNLPDLEVYSGDGATGTYFGTMYGVAPGTAGTYTYSTVNSATGDGETAPQLIGTATFTVAAGTNVTSLDFMDWPETIGIDNLKITFIPEAPTLAFLAFGALGLAWFTRRKHAGWAELLRSGKRA